VGGLWDKWLGDFRDAVRVSTRSALAPRLMISYDRSAIGQTGTGHYSVRMTSSLLVSRLIATHYAQPVGGYHAASDRVLMLDVARFKYPPHWVSTTAMAESMLTIDQ
jgi:glutathione gamma-glutamylcysteinyltransferase